MNPFVIGLTGSIGCGKSHILSVLVALGADGIDADRVAREVMAPGGKAFQPVLAEFGLDLLAADGAIDRTRLGRLVFDDPAALRRLEAIVHPAVSEAIRERIAVSQAPVVVIEAIKLIEAGLSRALCDQVWVAACSSAEQMARLAASRGMTPDEVLRRVAAQMTPSEMITHADRVINTDGSMFETAQKVVAAWIELGLPLPTDEE